MIDKTYIYIIHILVVAPLFIYTGYLGDKLATGTNEGYKKFFWLFYSLHTGSDCMDFYDKFI